MTIWKIVLLIQSFNKLFSFAFLSSLLAILLSPSSHS